MKGTRLLPLLLLSTLGCPQQKAPAPTRAEPSHAPPPKAVESSAATPSDAKPDPDAPTPEAQTPNAPQPKRPKLDLLSRIDDKIVDVDPTIGKPTDKSAPDPPPPPKAPPPQPRRAAAPRPTRRAPAPTPRRRVKRSLGRVSRTISHGQRVSLDHYLRNDDKLRVVEFYADW